MIPEAVDFLVKILYSDGSQPLWHGASDGLRKAAQSGDKRVQAALEVYSAKAKAHDLR